MSKLHLKVKIATLSQEQKIIARTERKLKRSYRRAANALARGRTTVSPDIVRVGLAGNVIARRELHDHSKKVVGSELRAANLAYAFLRGTPYEVVESAAYTKPDWAAVERNVRRFLDPSESWGVVGQRLTEWIEAHDPIVAMQARVIERTPKPPHRPGAHPELGLRPRAA